MLGVRVATVQPFPQVVNGVVRLVRLTGEHLDHFLARCTPYVIPPACPGRSLMQEANVPPGPDERNHESRASARVSNGSQNATYESVCAATTDFRIAPKGGHVHLNHMHGDTYL